MLIRFNNYHVSNNVYNLVDNDNISLIVGMSNASPWPVYDINGLLKQLGGVCSISISMIGFVAARRPIGSKTM